MPATAADADAMPPAAEMQAEDAAATRRRTPLSFIASFAPISLP